METYPTLIRVTQKVVHDLLYKIAGDEMRPCFIEEKNFDSEREFPNNIYPFPE